MGYTHYWYRPKTIDRSRYEAIVTDFTKLLEPLRQAGVELADGNGEGRPIITLDDVCFNGPQHCGHPQNHSVSIPWPSPDAGGIGPNSDAVNGSWAFGATLQERCCDGDCSYETFSFPRVDDRTQHTRFQGGLRFECTKTAFRPYDLAVTVFLVIAKHHLQDDIRVTSDGEEAQWFDAKMLCALHLGYGMDFSLTDESPDEEPEPPKPSPPRKYESAAESAKRIRDALKQKFPGIKFSVRSKTYSGGSSINISWVDGPTVSRVEPIANTAESISRDQWGEILSGGNRYVFCNRSASPELSARAMAKAVKEFGIPDVAPSKLDYHDHRYYAQILNDMQGPTAKPAKPPKPTTPTKPGKPTPAIPTPAIEMKEPDGPATKSQLFYLHCLAKMDTRNLKLTKRQASELIELAKAGHDIRSRLA